MWQRNEMKKAFIFFGIFLFSFALLFAQDYKGRGRIKGTVMDESGNPLEGVNVRLVHTGLNQGFEALTDSEGRWIASWIKGGSWNIDFEKAGYVPKKISIKVNEGSRNPDVEIKLEKIQGLSLSSALEERLEQANSLYEEKKFDEAIIAFNGIIEEFPDVYIINVSIGNCYFEKGNYDQAIICYKKALEKDPDNSEVKMYIANSYSNKGDSEKAQEWYNKIEFGKIQDVNVLYNLGTDFYAASKFSEALKYYKRAVELKGDFLDALFQLGLTYLSLGNNQEALETFENYLRQDPDSQRAAQVKGFIEYLKK
jgi:tetratricopeptide (TPR) repeat protein